jgi:OmcA/MtrC family decaheme c-type cytochrome
MCHTPQNTAGKGDFTAFIHKLHMGEELAKQELMFWSTTENYNEIKYPQDQRNCTTCHKGTVPDSSSKATIKACGSCHNAIDFTKEYATGGHVAGAQANDKQCVLCHDAATIKINHPVVGAVTNATSGVTSYYAHNGNLPTGAYKIEYVIDSVTLDAARKPSVKFGIKKDGALVKFGTYNAATNPNIIPNTVGGPSIRIAYNVTQDGITSPADFNAYMSAPALGMAAPTVTSSTATPPSTYTPAATSSNIWASGGTLTASGITWTLAGPDASGYYTLSSSVAVPASTTMVSALMYGSMTQTNVAAYPYAAASKADFKAYAQSATETRYAIAKPGLVTSADNALKASASTGLTARRTIVDNAKCNSCHEQLGLFTKSAFHGGGRNMGTSCNFCHNPNAVNSGWSYSFNTFVHGIHGAAMRTQKYTFAADWSTVTYPGLIKNCEQCHVAGSYDFTATANAAAAAGKLLFNTVGTGTTSVAGATTAPYIAQTAGTVYGSGFSYSTATGAVVTTEAAATTLVSSPISAACFSCHDSKTAMSHMQSNGGSLYAARAGALARTEECLVCHGPANNAVFNETPPSIKTVHRWW